MNSKFSTFFLLMLLSVFPLIAQNVTITGVISDKVTGETLIGAKVLQKGTNNGTITNFDGNFTVAEAFALHAAELDSHRIGNFLREFGIRTP